MTSEDEDFISRVIRRYDRMRAESRGGSVEVEDTEVIVTADGFIKRSSNQSGEQMELILTFNQVTAARREEGL